MQGTTGTYLQYAYARIRSIFRKGGIDPETVRAAEIALAIDHPAERCLAMEIARLAETLESAALEYRPNLLTNDLSAATANSHVWYEIQLDPSTNGPFRRRALNPTANESRHSSAWRKVPARSNNFRVVSVFLRSSRNSRHPR